MVYVVPDWKKSIKQNVFEFQLDGKGYEAPRFDLLPTTFYEAISELEEKYALKAMRLALAGDDEKLAKALGELPLSELQNLLKAWQDHAGVDLGESKASVRS